MAQIVKSVLFFDLDSLKRSLAGNGPDVAEVFASKIREWLAGIEDGSLLTPRPNENVRRKILMKRCYADPKTLGADRDVLTANGVQVVDCPAMPGHGRSSADLHMVLDTGDAIDHQTGFNEFILLTAESDLTPILFRLRAHDRASIIYSTPATEASYKSLADGVLDERALVGLLAPGKESGAKIALAYTNEDAPVEKPRKAEREAPVEKPAPVTAPVAAAAPASSKEELSALVRRLHQATRVPLFSPKTFSELFRLLAEEVAENGYRFQTTAENVAAKLIENGRKVTRRQVGFVVKGLALKGHTFAADDRPQDLASEFRDQVLYLCKAANITLNEREMSLLTAWVAGGASAAAAAAPAAQPTQARAGMVERMRKSVVSRITGDGAKRPKAKPAPEAETEPETEADDEPAVVAAPAPAKAQMIGPQPEPIADAPALQPAAEVEEAPAAEAKDEIDELPEPLPPPPKEERSKRGTPLASIPDAPRITPAARKPSLVAGAKRASTARAAKSSASAKKASPAPSLSLTETDEVENSILAAIAEAVDVLVEDRATDTVKPKAESAKADTPKARESKAPPKAIEPDAESDDIGDEIQRILASYSQDRQSGR